VELESDVEHCGACGNACSPGRACEGSRCASGWLALSPPPLGFVAREQPAFAAFGSQLFIFGGLGADGLPLNSGAIYDLRTDSWKLVSAGAGTPNPRNLGTALWTSGRILLWGGRGSVATGIASRNGAFYDPEADSWSPLPEGSTGRVGAAAGASATHAVLWGGWVAATPESLQDGAERYNINGGVWDSAMTDNNPGRLLHAAWAFSGTELFVYGGRPDGAGKTDRAYRYNLTYNTWSELPSGPLALWGSFGVWDGATFYAWAGREETSSRASGAVYGGRWAEMATLGAPSPRWAAQSESGWGFALDRDDVLFLGGLDTSGEYLHDGGRYDRALDTWKAVPPWPSTEDHQWGVGALVDGEIVVWGGRTAGVLSATGQRYKP